MDTGKKDSGRWSDTWYLLLTFSRTLPVGGGLLVPCSLPGSPVGIQLMQMVSRDLARVGGFSQCASLTKLKTCLLLYVYGTLQ